MERRRIRDCLFLPGVGPGLQRQRRDVEELRRFEEGGAEYRRIVGEGLTEIPGRSSHDEEMVVAAVAVPDGGAVGVGEEVEQILAVEEAGVLFGAVEVFEGVEGGVVGEVDGGGEMGVGGEAGVLEHAAVEDELEHRGIGAVPAPGGVVGFVTEAVIGGVGAEIVEDWVFGAIGKEVEIELGREVADVDPSVCAVGLWIGVLRRRRRRGGSEKKEEDSG